MSYEMVDTSPLTANWDLACSPELKNVIDCKLVMGLVNLNLMSTGDPLGLRSLKMLLMNLRLILFI